MSTSDLASLVWLTASGYAMAVASAVLPWLNAEVIALSFAALARSRAHLVAIALVITAGQMTGKSAMYWTARGASAARIDRLTPRVAAWQLRLGQSGPRQLLWVFASAALGVPPLYVVTLLAGVTKLSFGRFLAVATVGRLVHFGALVLTPGLLS